MAVIYINEIRRYLVQILRDLLMSHFTVSVTRTRYNESKYII